jgi:iron-sulfur cluster assembly protein
MNIINPINITDKAIAEIKSIIQNKFISDDYGLRVGLKGAGCGATYLLGFDLPTKADDVFQVENINVVIDRKHLMYLVGIKIDFEAGDSAEGFTFIKKENQ